MQNFKQQERKLCGDILLTTAFISYLGFFTKKYRQNLMDGTWRPYLSQLKVRTARISPAHISPWVPVSSHDSNNRNLLVPSRILSPTTTRASPNDLWGPGVTHVHPCPSTLPSLTIPRPLGHLRSASLFLWGSPWEVLSTSCRKPSVMPSSRVWHFRGS